MTLSEKTDTHPTVYHAPARHKAEERLGLFHKCFPDAVYQTMEPPEPHFHAAGHVQRVQAGAILR